MSFPPTISQQLQKDSTTFSIPIPTIKTLLSTSMKIKEKAYCPYSNFPVGCALLTSSGDIVTGVNIENASYPVGICAERTALSKAISEGVRDFKALAVSTDIEVSASTGPTSPCGMCRQFIAEFCGKEVPVFMTGGTESVKEGAEVEMEYAVVTVGELLPFSFGAEALKLVGKGKVGVAK